MKEHRIKKLHCMFITGTVFLSVFSHVSTCFRRVFAINECVFGICVCFRFLALLLNNDMKIASLYKFLDNPVNYIGTNSN